MRKLKLKEVKKRVQDDTAGRWRARTLKLELFSALNHNIPPQFLNLGSGEIGPEGL